MHCTGGRVSPGLAPLLPYPLPLPTQHLSPPLPTAPKTSRSVTQCPSPSGHPYRVSYGTLTRAPPGFIGNFDFALSTTDGSAGDPVPETWHLWLWNWSFCSAATTILSGSIAERATFASYMIYAVRLLADVRQQGTSYPPGLWDRYTHHCVVVAGAIGPDCGLMRGPRSRVESYQAEQERDGRQG